VARAPVRLAYAEKYPAQLDTTLRAYRWLLDQDVPPKHIVLGGDSSGAILVFGLLQLARRESLPVPAGCVILSGWLDLALTSASYETNKDKDVFFNRVGNQWLVANALGEGGDPRDPLVSTRRGRALRNASAFLCANSKNVVGWTLNGWCVERSTCDSSPQLPI